MSNKAYRRTFDDFEIGQIFEHWPGKTITESDNNLFSLLTMNHHPIHLDQDHASRTRFKRTLVVGTLSFSLVVGLTVPDISGAAIANLGYADIEHRAPVFVGDTLYASSKIVKKMKSANGKSHGIIEVETKACNQDRQEVLFFRRTILLPLHLEKNENVSSC